MPTPTQRKRVEKILIALAIIPIIFFTLVKLDVIQGQFCLVIMNDTYTYPNWKYMCIT